MVKLVDLLVGIGVGLLDEAVEGREVKVAGYKVKAEEIARPALFVGALVADLLNIGGRTGKAVAEAVEVATAPLLTKTVVKKAKELAAKKYSGYTAYTAESPELRTAQGVSAARSIATVVSY